jgi:hypothetical protein
MVWFGTKKAASASSLEAQMAKDSSERSKEQALEDLAKSEEKLQESLPVIEALRDHNERNHYDEWLRSLTQGT